MLRDYLENLDEVVQFEEIDYKLTDTEVMLEVASQLRDENAQLQKENAQLQYELQQKKITVNDPQIQEEIDKLQEENKKLQSIVNDMEAYTQTVIENTVHKKIEQAKKETLQQVLDTFGNKMKMLLIMK